MDSNNHTSSEARAADAGALEALIAAGWNAELVDPAMRDRARRVASFLGVLGTPVGGGGTSRTALVDLVMAGLRPAAPARLAPMDEEAADAWVRAGFKLDRVPSDIRERAARHAGLADLLGAGLAGADPTARRDLIDRTMRSVAQAPAVPSDVLPISRGRFAGRFRLTDLATVAAAVLVFGAVLWPMVSAFRASGMRTACQANMGLVAAGLSQYAQESQDSLPIATASFGDVPWWDVGRPTSNSANLFKLYRDGFVSGEALACPGNPGACKPNTGALPPDAPDWQRLEQVSYSMQILRGPDQPAWGHGEVRPVLSDRSPVVLAALQGRSISPESNSPNHAGYGQCVMMSDGSVVWTTTPVLDGDNIWFPRVVEDVIRVMRGEAPPEILKGTEIPGKNDAFFGP